MSVRNYTFNNVLITGGAGFIGSNFARYFIKKYPSVNIWNLDSLTYAGSLNNLKDISRNEQHHFIHGDICDENLVMKILRDNAIDTIIHFAAESHVDRSIEGPSEFIQTNIHGTFNLLECAKHYWLDENNFDASQCHFHHISTDEVYGSLQKNDPAFVETTPYAPNSPYAASKAASDHLVRSYFKTFRLPVTLSNCSNNYGPFQHKEKFIPTVIEACINNMPIPIYGDGSNIRDWLHVSDHCYAIDRILQKGVVGDTYNVGGNEEWANIDIARLVCKTLDRLLPKSDSYESQITYVTDRPGHDWRYAIDSSKILSTLAWKPKVSFQHGIEETIRFYM